MNRKNIVVGMMMASLTIAEPVRAEETKFVVSSTHSCTECSVSNRLDTEEIQESPFNSRGRSSETLEPEIMEISHEDEREHQVEILEQALELANTLENLSERVRLLGNIAIKYADFGQLDRSFEILLIAHELATTIENPQERGILLSEITLKEAELQPNKIAAERLSTAIEIANTIEDLQQRTRLLSEISLKLAEIGETDLASAILSQTQKTVGLPEVSEEPQLFPFEQVPWNGRVGLSSNFFSGNKTTSVVGLSFGLERKWPTDEFDFGLNLSNNFDDSRVAPQDDNQFQGSIDAEYRHHNSARWQYFINSAVRRDDLDSINLRSSLYTGPGINLWRAPGSRTFDMQLGLGVRFEDSNRRSNDFDAPVAQYRLRYKDLLFDSLRLRQFLTFELPFQDTADYYISSSTNVAVPITGGWSFSNFLRIRYAAKPTLGNPNLQVDVKTGLEYNF